MVHAARTALKSKISDLKSLRDGSSEISTRLLPRRSRRVHETRNAAEGVEAPIVRAERGEADVLQFPLDPRDANARTNPTEATVSARETALATGQWGFRVRTRRIA